MTEEIILLVKLIKENAQLQKESPEVYLTDEKSPCHWVYLLVKLANEISPIIRTDC